MFIPHHAYDNNDREPIAIEQPKFKVLKDDVKVHHESTPEGDLEWENYSVNYTKGNGIIKGFILALPFSILFWVIILFWAIIICGIQKFLF